MILFRTVDPRSGYGHRYFATLTAARRFAPVLDQPIHRVQLGRMTAGRLARICNHETVDRVTGLVVGVAVAQ